MFLSNKSPEIYKTYKITDTKTISNYLKTVNTDSDMNDFHIELANKFAECTITKTIKPTPNFNNYPYYTSELEKIRKLRNKFYKLKKTHQSIEYYNDQFKHYKYLLIKQIELEKRKYYSHQISKVLHEPRQLWKKMHEIMTDKKQSSSIKNIIFY